MTVYGKIEPLGMEESLSIPIGLVHDLSAARTKSESLNAFAFWSGRIVQAQRCSVAVPDGDNLIVTGLAGNEIIANRTEIPINGSFLGDVFRSQKADIQTDLQNQTSLNAKILAEAGMQTVMIAPLLAGGRCLGTLAFAFDQECGKDLNRLEVIRALAQCLATQLLVLDQISELQRMVHTDSLTETNNRRYLSTVSPEIWDAWRKDAVPFSVVTIDIDHFKAVNDTHGHNIGDQVLQIVAARLKDCMRAGDDVVRLGGEEFLLILRNANAAAARHVANRVHKAVGNELVTIGDTQLKITVSVGVSNVMDSDAGLSCVCDRSDAALYSAKDAGRNRIACS